MNKKYLKFVLRLMRERKFRVSYVAKTGFYNFLSDEQYLKYIFKIYMKQDLNLSQPRSFNEKIQWLKLYDRKEIYKKLVDKIEVKHFVADRIGEEYVIPTIGVWNSVDEIDFDMLPDKFVIKCNHDSGGLCICKDKSKICVDEVKRKLSLCLKTNYYNVAREWAYKDIQPRIIAEELLEDENRNGVIDYKLMCFNGKVNYILVCSDRFSKGGVTISFYDRRWKEMPFTRANHPRSIMKIPRPRNLDLMMELAERLAIDITFVRVDFYEIKDKVYFGEMTLYPSGGVEGFNPSEWDYKLGELLTLPIESGEI